MDHWVQYVVAPPGYQHVSKEDLADVNFMSKHFQVMENSTKFDWHMYMYNWMVTCYQHLPVWIWLLIFVGGYMCILCLLLLPLYLVLALYCHISFQRSIKKHKCFVFCSGEDRDSVHENVVNVLKSKGVTVGFNHEVDNFNQIGRSNFANISYILENYRHIMIFISNNYADDIDELKMLYFIITSNPSQTILSLSVDGDERPFVEKLDRTVQVLTKICQYRTDCSCISLTALCLVQDVHSDMLEKDEYDTTEL
jgi:hypothetical protein